MRRMKTATVLVAAAALALVGLGTTTANAATSGSTDATFTLVAGGINITVPASTVNLGSVNSPATSLTGLLGTVSVSDQRGAFPAAWTATVTTTPFTTGGGSGNETVAPASISYSSGLVTSTGLGVFTPTPTAVAVGTGVAGVALTLGTGNNTASWNPSITFALGASQVSGTYSGTITHSLT